MKSPNQILDAMVNTAVAKTSRTPLRAFGLAVLAGMYIAFAGAGATMASASVPLASLAKLVSACVFPAGLAMVIMAGSELFTGNCLIITGVLQQRCTAGSMVKNWIIVWCGNLCGGMLVVLLLAGGNLYGSLGGEFATAAISAAAAKCSLSFSAAFFRGILCNILVCLAVWIAAGCDSAASKLAGLYFPILLFVVCGYEHSVANMYYIPAGFFAAITTGTALPESLTLAGCLGNLFAVTLGNIVGGAAVGAVYFALLSSAKKDK